jgi:hypothetical protein
MSIFDLIRQVGDADISLATKGFFLRLIPFVNSKRLSLTWSVERVARKLDLSLSSVKRYRRELISVGSLENENGWIFKVDRPTEAEPEADVESPVEETPEPENTTQVNRFKSEPVQNDRFISEPPRGSNMNPHNHYINTASYTAIDRSIARARSLDSIPTRFRPDVKTRKPEHPFDLDTWSSRWKSARGKNWLWVEWSNIVCPYLTVVEQDELFAVLSGVENPNLAFARSIVNRMISGRTFGRGPNRRVPVSKDDDELFDAIG